MEKIGEELREKILIVQKRSSRFATTADTLAHWGYAIVTAAPSLALLDKVTQESPDLILFDHVATDEGSRQLCLQLKADRFTHHIPILVWGTQEPSERIQWLSSRADLCLDWDALPVELVARIRALLKRSVEYDPATSLPAAAYLHRQLDAWLAKNLPLAVLYIRIDHFQIYRVTYGPEASRRVLLKLAKLMVEALPPGNMSVAHLDEGNYMAVLPLEVAQTFHQTLAARFGAAQAEFEASPDSGGTAARFSPPLESPTTWHMTLSIALVTNEHRALINYVQVSSLLSQQMERFHLPRDTA